MMLVLFFVVAVMMSSSSRLIVVKTCRRTEAIYIYIISRSTGIGTYIRSRSRID